MSLKNVLLSGILVYNWSHVKYNDNRYDTALSSAIGVHGDAETMIGGAVMNSKSMEARRAKGGYNVDAVPVDLELSFDDSESVIGAQDGGS